jgi:hypothetical protein
MSSFEFQANLGRRRYRYLLVTRILVGDSLHDWHCSAGTSRLRLLMAVLIRASAPQHLDERWRSKLDGIWQRYKSEPNPQTKTEHLQLLKQFTDLALRGKL